METKQEKLQLNHERYRWFFTSSGKLVVGGKSSLQNDELLIHLKRSKKDFIVMHTTSPGSPFSVILEEKNKVTKEDLEETAIFTGCFSRAWKEKKAKTPVDIFSLSQLYKTKAMKAGTWGVKGKVERKEIVLELVLTKQNGKLRAVPKATVKKKDRLLEIKPGNIDKKEMIAKFQIVLSEHFSEEELLSALPPGGVAIKKEIKETEVLPGDSCVLCSAKCSKRKK